MSFHDKHWGRHPAVRTGDALSFGERAADLLRAGMGSWVFIFAFLGFMAAWAVWNAVAIFGLGFDPYPYILLNLMLSTLAGLQGGILLISAKRQDSINSALADHDRQILADVHRILRQQEEMGWPPYLSQQSSSEQASASSSAGSCSPASSTRSPSAGSPSGSTTVPRKDTP